MSSSYAVEMRDGKPVDVLTHLQAGTRLVVARLGAEPVSLARRDAAGGWTGFLWRDGDLSKNPDGWSNHATVMGYYLHRLKDGRSVYRGHEIRGGTHSFLRHKTFAEPVVRIEPDDGASLIYTMPANGYEASEYPFRVALHLSYTLEPSGAWRVTFRFTNEEPELTTHVSFGLHPGFAVGSLERAEILLPAGTYRRHLAPDNFLSGETVSFEHPGGAWQFDRAKLPDSFLIEPVDVAERVFAVLDPAGGRRVDLACPTAPYLTIWSDGHAFICLEPCWGLPDAHQQLPFEDKLGIQEIAPGGSLERDFTLRATRL
jgi:galactose mutarotase-like enzyme